MADPLSILSDLPHKQRRFVEEYVIDFNATQAAIRAGYSARSAYSQAGDLLKKPEIQLAVKDLSAKASAKAALTVERVCLEIARIAFADPRKALHANGQPKKIDELDDDTAAVIAGIDVVDQFRETADGQGSEFCGYLKKIKFHDKNAALLMAGRYLKMFTDKLNLQGTLTLEEAILASEKLKESEDAK